MATIMSSIGGGATSIVVSFIKTRKLQVNYLIDGLLSSIVSITGKLLPTLMTSCPFCFVKGPKISPGSGMQILFEKELKLTSFCC